MSMIWIYMLANLIVDILTLFDIMSGISVALLGLTLLSWGNSIGDALASISISKKGFGEMAITGCVAGPVFNLMFGMGLTTLRCNVQLKDGIQYGVNEEWDTQFKLTVFTLTSSIFTTCLLTWLVVTNDFKVAKWHAKALITSYLMIVAVLIYLSF